MDKIMKAERIRVRILIPLVLMLGVLLALFIAVFYWQQKEVMSDNLARLMQVLDQSIETQLQSDASKMSALIDMISPDQELKAAFLAQDRQGLLKLATPLLKRLGAEHQVTHLYFINPDRKVFLRAHRPGQYGDTVSRHTLLQAEETGEPASGIELGIHGESLLLRAVMPWYDGEELLGYIEMSEDIRHIIDKVHDLQDAEFYVTIYKEFLDRLHWEAGMRERGGKPDWEQFADSVLINNTLQAMPENIAEIQARHHYATLFKTGAEGRSYRIGFLPLFDASGRMVGDIAILYDITGLLAGARTLFFFIAIIVFLLGGTICVLFYFILGRVERQLALVRKEKETLQASHITELEQKKAGLEQDKSKLDAANREMNKALAEQHKIEQRLSDQANKSEQARYAMLYMLEDMNKSTAMVEQIKDEWVRTFDAVTDPIFSHDADFRIVRANRAYAECAGMNVEDVIGRLYWEVFPKGDGPLAGCLRTIEKAEEKEEEEEIRLENGQTFLNRTYAMRQKRDNPYSIHLMEDITERKQAERALLQSEESLRNLVEADTNALVVHRDFRLIYANPAAKKLFEAPEGVAVPDISVLDYVHPDYRNFTRLSTQRMIRMNKSLEAASIQMVTPSGRQLDIEITSTPITFEHQQVVLSIIHDVTERKQSREALERSYERLQQSLEGTIQAIASAVEARDPYTAGHQRRVAKLSVAIGQAMGLDEKKIEGIHWGALIHDIGKINLPAEILSKPSKLTEIEYSLIQSHPQVGYDILKDIEFPWPVADIAHQHHERLDGSGYPQGIRGEEICLEARIVAVADVVEAMASHRPYRPGLGLDAALKEIADNSGKLYDAEVVDACLRLFQESKFSFEE